MARWKRRFIEGLLWYELVAHNARVFARGKREGGMYRWIVQHPSLVYFGWSKSLPQAMEDAECRARVIDRRVSGR